MGILPAAVPPYRSGMLLVAGATTVAVLKCLSASIRLRKLGKGAAAEDRYLRGCPLLPERRLTRRRWRRVRRAGNRRCPRDTRGSRTPADPSPPVQPPVS